MSLISALSTTVRPVVGVVEFYTSWPVVTSPSQELSVPMVAAEATPAIWQELAGAAPAALSGYRPVVKSPTVAPSAR